MSEVTLWVSGYSAPCVFVVDSLDQDTAASMAMSLLMADWSLDDRMNTDVELVGVRPVTV